MERLDKHFKAITHAAFERHGFAKGEILNQWPSIAGDKLARSATPLRVVWPRQSPASQKSGGTLVVRVDPALALDLQYEAPRVIERVNSYFGYAAIAAIRIMQGQVAGSDRRLPRAAERDSAEERQLLRAQLSGIADESLQDALSRLGSRIHRQREKPTRT
jgi:hypothetical protein